MLKRYSTLKRCYNTGYMQCLVPRFYRDWETKIGGTSKNGHNIGTVDQTWNFVTSS